MDDMKIALGAVAYAVRFAHDNPELFRQFIARKEGMREERLPSPLMLQRIMEAAHATLEALYDDIGESFEESIVTMPPEITNV